MLTIHLVSQWLLLKQIIVKGTKLVVQKCLILVQYQRFHYDEPQEMWVTDILDSFCSLSAHGEALVSNTPGVFATQRIC